MALTSPGVEVTVIDQSQYLPAAPGSVPFVLVATAQDKADPNGIGIAQGTTAANANKLYEVTSQRDLVTLFGTPTFYTTSNGTPIQGYELNEYGLLAAYSVLGVTNRCYVLRADIDLASLVGQTGRPVGAPANATYWLDSLTSTWGIFEFNSATGGFTLQNPIVITDDANLTGGVPLQTIGQQGNYAVVAISQSGSAPLLGKQYFYKATTNDWVVVGSDDWYLDWPAVQSTISNPTLDSGDIFNLTFNNSTVQIGPGFTSVEDVRDDINNLGFGYLSAEVRSGKLCVFINYPEQGTPIGVSFSENTGTPLADMGITPNSPYYMPKVFYGTSAQQPTWQTGQTYPRPSGSVWFKVGGNGIVPVVEEYDSVLQSFVAKTVPLSTSDYAVNATLDPTGGQAIPAGSVYAQYNFNQSYLTTAPVYLWKRTATGATVITGTNTSPDFSGLLGGGPYEMQVYVSTPGLATLDGPYTITIQDGDDASDFVIAWSAAAIPNTLAAVATSGAIQLTHTEGGVIVMNDIVSAAGSDQGFSYGVLVEAGFIANTTDGVKFGSTVDSTFVNIAQDSSSGTGTGASFTVTVSNGKYIVDPDTIGGGGGTGYAVGEAITILGSDLGGVDVTNDLTLEVAEISGSTPFTLTNVQITGTSGTFTCNASASTLVVDQSVVITGAITPGTITGYTTGPTTYYIIATNGSTTFTLSTSLGGSAVSTTAGALGGAATVVVNDGPVGPVTSVQYSSGDAVSRYNVTLSNWVEFDYTANEGAPVANPANNTNWFYSVVDEVDIMVNYNGAWKGYKNQNYDLNGFPTPTGSNATDPNGPIVSASAPELQSDGTALVYGDLWIDTSNLDNYPVIYRWQSVNGDNQWVLIDNTDQTNPSGIVFADARWATNGTTSVTDDPIPTIVSLLTSNYLDIDAPDDALYPTGMLLFNTRRSGYNVKQFRANYFNGTSFPDVALPTEKNAWVTVSGNMDNGAPYMGRKAQRAMVVEGLRAAIETNTEIRDEDNFFNLMATPNYPELQPNMIALNSDRGETGYILGDTPLGLADTANAITAWATNAAGAASTGEEGLVTRNTYLGLFYPSGRTTDLSGNLVAVPASHMMLRTFIRNDTIAYPWLAAAGTRRGIIDNATSIGYVNRQTGEFVSIRTRIGIRDTLYTNFINPLVFFTGQGLLNYGNKTSFNSQSALDRTNVARLVAYIRRQLTLAARPYVFEPNDSITRNQIQLTCESLMLDLIAKRGIFDYLVVCDDSNNTPERIDRNELWVDIAIEPVKAVEFIYIPVRVLNTGELGA